MTVDIASMTITEVWVTIATTIALLYCLDVLVDAFSPHRLAQRPTQQPQGKSLLGCRPRGRYAGGRRDGAVRGWAIGLFAALSIGLLLVGTFGMMGSG